VTRDQVFEFFRRLAELNPSPTTELESSNPYQLLVAVVLSAQATDASVNIATRELFGRVKAPREMVELGEDALRDAIKIIGLFNTKARNVIALSEALIRDHGGEVPRTRDELQALPGVGRKTANVVLNTAWGEETFAVDTHVFRVCNRTGLAPGKTVDEVEAKLEKIVPQPFRRDAHHWLILHGRYTCKARTPECWRCPVIDLCRYQPKTPPPGERTKPSAARTGRRASSTARTAKVRSASPRLEGRNRSRPTRLP
jgi:endonuclease-3